MSDAKLSPFSTAAMPPSSTGMSPMSSYTLLLFTLSLAQFTETVYSQPYGLDIEGSFAAVFHNLCEHVVDGLFDELFAVGNALYGEEYEPAEEVSELLESALFALGYARDEPIKFFYVAA